MTSASFPTKRPGLPSSAEEVVGMARRLLAKRPGRGPVWTPKRTKPVEIAGRREWGQDLAELIDELCKLPAGRAGLEKILRNAPEILRMVNTRRAQAHIEKSGHTRATTNKRHAR